jgi:hypothetical protein
MDTIPTSKVKLRTALPLIATKGKLLNADDCYDWIFNRSKLIGWTYNFNRMCCLWQHFEKLISCQGQPAKQVRIANNTHIKCYIGKDSMLVGSFNLTQATVQDLCIEVKDIVLLNYMRRMFNQHWKALE